MTTETLPSPAPAASLPAASDVLAAPMAPEVARQAIEDRKGDREFYKRLTGNDAALKAAALADWTKLHEIAYPRPTQVASAEDVASQAAARNAEQWNSYEGFLAQFFPVTPAIQAELRAGELRADLHALVAQEKSRLVKDRGFYRRLMEGDREATEKWQRVITALSLRPVPAK